MQLTLGVSDGGKGDEIAALRQLLVLVKVEGCLVTADAMHAQTETAKAIVDSKADYLLALKANKEDLFQGVKHYFERVQAGQVAAKDQ